MASPHGAKPKAAAVNHQPQVRSFSLSRRSIMEQSRRGFLADVGKGMLIASVGPALATELGLTRAFGADGPERLTFGDREPLVSLLQDTPADKLLPILVDKLKNGTEMGALVGAAALANARTFGGQDYDGYHAFMALVPACHMAKELPEERRARPRPPGPSPRPP